jgi:two-component system NtrC family response regulator
VLASRFLHRVAPEAGLGPDALAWLTARRWPGNVRELRAVVESAGALILPGHTTVDASLLSLASGEAPPESQIASGMTLRDKAGSAAGADEHVGALDSAVNELERRLLRDALAATQGNQSEAARRLGISRVGLIKKLARLGLR